VNLRAVLWLLGRVILFLAAFQLVPAAVAYGYGERGDAFAFLAGAVIAGLVGAVLGWRPREGTIVIDDRPTFFRREGLAVVGLSWLVSAVLGAVPFVLTGAIASPVDAFFESASGFTTTGATILEAEEIDGLSRSVAFWRSFTQWLGGIGIVLVFVVFFPTGGRSLFRSEVPGVSREASHHRVRDSAIGLARVYVAMTVLLILGLRIAGMGVYDAVLHALTTIPTGGFSNHGESIAFFGSWVIEALLILFMFLAGINFAIYDAWIRRGWRSVWSAFTQSTEIRVYAGTLLGAAIVITSVLWFWGGSNGYLSDDPALVALPDYSRLLLCLRDSVFSVVSIQTSTGFGTADFDRWPDFCRALLMVLAMMGACAGSTGGGIKVVRLIIVAKAALRGVQAFARPRALHSVRVDGQTLDEGTVAAVTGYFALWFLIFGASTVTMAFFELDLVTAATAVLATLNNIGPGLAEVGPTLNFGEIPAFGKLLLSMLMVLGRLEFYALVVLLLPRFWRV
jgi:trk system potassium uptake protein TrkH